MVRHAWLTCSLYKYRDVFPIYVQKLTTCHYIRLLFKRKKDLIFIVTFSNFHYRQKKKEIIFI